MTRSSCRSSWLAAVSVRRRAATVGLFVLALLCGGSPSVTWGQFNIGGVYIDPDGILREAEAKKPGTPASPRATARLRAELQQATGRRAVSLKRLEERMRASHDVKEAVPDEVQYLAGLQEVQTVLFDTAAGDIVLTGPAEPWRITDAGEVVGEKSGRPVLRLEDLVTALRYAFDPAARRIFIGCSIEPTADGMASYGRYLSQAAAQFDRSRVPAIMRGMEQAAGHQRIVVYGVPGESRLAAVMVSADYRLKRLAMGHDPLPVAKLKNYFDLMAQTTAGSPARLPQHRWWFVGQYDAIQQDENGAAMEFVGPGLRVETAAAVAGLRGTGKAANEPKPAKAATLLAEGFTQALPELSQRFPIFAELRNVVALGVIATAIENHTPRGSQGAESETWRPTYWLDTERCVLPKYHVPKETPSLASVRLIRNRHWTFSVSGGVEITPSALAEPGRIAKKESDRMRTARTSLTARPAEPTAFFWDY